MDLPSLIALLATVPYVGPFLPYIPLVCGLAAIIDAVVPPPPEGSPWVGARKVVHMMALNIGYARNAVPSGAIPASVAEKATEMRAVTAAVESAAGELAQRAEGKPEAVKIVPVLALLAAGLALSACTTANRIVVDGQLFCATATAAGPLVVALANASGAPVIVTGAAAADVAAACRVIGAIPVSPPPNPAAAPVVAAVLP